MVDGIFLVWFVSQRQSETEVNFERNESAKSSAPGIF